VQGSTRSAMGKPLVGELRPGRQSYRKRWKDNLHFDCSACSLQRKE